MWDKYRCGKLEILITEHVHCSYYNFLTNQDIRSLLFYA